MRKEIEKKWADYYAQNEADRKYMGGKNCTKVFITFLRKESYGNENADKRYVVGTLAIVGVSKEDAEQYFEQVIKGDY